MPVPQSDNVSDYTPRRRGSRKREPRVEPRRGVGKHGEQPLVKDGRKVGKDLGAVSLMEGCGG